MNKPDPTIMKRTKIATQDKSKKCSLSTKDNPCYPSVQTVQIGDTETRDLCQVHLLQYQRGRLDFKPKFEKATDI